MKYSQRTALLAALAGTASAHTWVEQLMVVAPNGTMVGQPGFPRGNVKRGTPGFGDPAMVNIIPAFGRPINQIFDTDLMCKETQAQQTQTDGSPRLQAAAGANVALRYQENGHVSLPQNQPGKPQNRGTVYVYGTTRPSADDKFLSIHRVWNAEGTGGDGRGVLLSTRDFDDSQCYQVNGGQISATRQKTFSHATSQLMGADLWCQQDIQIPATASSGQPYSLYWVWDWPTMPGTEGFPEGKQEIYTTCMDVDVIANNDVQNKAVGNSFVKGQDLGSAAIAAQIADIANPTAVSGQSIPFAAASGTPGPSDTSGFTSFISETAPIATSTRSASVPVNTNSNGGPPASDQRTRSRTRTRPSVSPFVSSTTPPSVQSTQSVGNNGPGNRNGNNDGSSIGRPSVSPISSAAAPQNTGTAIVGANNNGDNNRNTNAAAASTTTTTTATVTGASSIVTRVQTAFQTVTETKMQTIFQSKRDEPAPTTLPTDSPSIHPSTVRACSKTEPAYKLRARNPFFILPNTDATGVDC